MGTYHQSMLIQLRFIDVSLLAVTRALTFEVGAIIMLSSARLSYCYSAVPATLSFFVLGFVVLGGWGFMNSFNRSGIEYFLFAYLFENILKYKVCAPDIK
jgi:hypothetical protein